jgi:hypothetical protein
MEWIQKIMEFGEPIATALGWLSVVVAAVLRMPFIGDTSKADGIILWIQKALSWLPTIGINPRTKSLEDAMAEVKGE